MKRHAKTLMKLVLLCLFLSVAGVIITNTAVLSAKKRIITADAAAQKDADCVLVLGAFVNGATLSPMLEDRVLTGMEVYKSGGAKKMLMSGDHGTKQYDEVNAMMNYANARGIDKNDIFTDHAGFSTYESVYRAKEIFGVDSMIIVTQEFHLPRALYIAKILGIEAYGVCADRRVYMGERHNRIREIPARVKDFLMCIFKPEPAYLGDAIPISGSADLSHD